MADRRIGQTAKLKGKDVVWSGNHGWQSPASHNKLKEEGRFRAGAQAIDRVGNAIQRTGLPAKAKEAQQKFRDVTDKVPGVKAAERAVNKGSERSSKLPGSRVAQGGAIAAERAGKALNVDARVAAGLGLLLGSVRTGGGSSSSTAGQVRARIQSGAQARARNASRPDTYKASLPNARPANTIPAGSNAPSAGLSNARRNVRRAIQNDPPTAAAQRSTAATKASSSPGLARNISTEQAQANAKRAARSSPASTTNKGLTSGRIDESHVARKAAGPVKRSSPGNELDKGNTVVPAGAANSSRAQANRNQAVTRYGKGSASAGSKPSGRPGTSRSPALDKQNSGPRNNRGWNEETGKIAARQRDANIGTALMPNGGRVNPKAATDRGIKVQQAEKAGRANLSQARSAARAEVKAAKNVAQEEARRYQRRIVADTQKGSDRASMESMSRRIAQSPRVQGPRRPPTTTTGTRQVAANPSTGSRRGVVGRVVTTSSGETKIVKAGSSPLRENPRSKVNFDDSVPATRRAGRQTDPKTGRAYQPSGNDPTKRSAKTPSASTRQARGGNPAENFPQRSGRAPMTGQTPNRTGGSPIKSEAEGRYVPPSGSGFDVRGRRLGNTGGIRPVDSRGSSTPARYTGSASKDGYVTRNGKKIPRVSKSPTAVSGTTGVQTSAERAAPLVRSSERRAQLKEASRQNSAASRQRPRSAKEARALQNKWDNKLSATPGTTRSGEVRLQGSAKGNQYQTGIDSGTKDGRVGKAGPHDGTQSRVVGSPKNQGRSSEASSSAKKTLESVRSRRTTATKKESPRKTANLGPVKNTIKKPGSSARNLRSILRAIRGR